jgi:5-(carboxyamino)imidazole ribonucleotide mutase
MRLKVLIVMGSDSDLDALMPAIRVLGDLNVEHEVHVASAHRTPDRVVALATGARKNGFGIVIAAAGGAAHLAGVIAAHTTLPVLAVPIAVGTLGGIDALLSAIQMPGGVPVASVGVGGARNAGLFAAQMLSVNDPTLSTAIESFRRRQESAVAEADARVKAKLASDKGQGK